MGKMILDDQNDCLPRFLFIKVIVYQNGCLPRFLTIKVIVYQSDCLSKWLSTKVFDYQNDCLSKWLSIYHVPQGSGCIYNIYLVVIVSSILMLVVRSIYPL